MIYTNKEYCLEVKGSMACFTRPEMKVERVSYDIITPSAARAIFESIFWKTSHTMEYYSNRSIKSNQMVFHEKK